MGNTNFGFGTHLKHAIFSPLVIDGTPFIQFELLNGDLLLSMSALDQSGNEVLLVRRNMLSVSNLLWDYDAVSQRAILRTGRRKVLLDIQFKPPDTLRIRRARIFRNGVEFVVMSGFNILINNGTVMSNINVQNLRYGIVIGDALSDGPIASHIDCFPRQGVNREAALRVARQTMTTMRRTFQGLEASTGPFGDELDNELMGWTSHLDGLRRANKCNDS
jgi:hypothetical protein